MRASLALGPQQDLQVTEKLTELKQSNAKKLPGRNTWLAESHSKSSFREITREGLNNL